MGRTDLPHSNEPDMPPDPLHRSPRSSLGLALALQKKGWVLLQTSEILFSIIVWKLRRRSSAFGLGGAEETGSFTSSYCMAAAFAGVAILLVVFLRKPETDPAGDQRA